MSNFRQPERLPSRHREPFDIRGTGFHVGETDEQITVVYLRQSGYVKIEPQPGGGLIVNPDILPFQLCNGTGHPAREADFLTDPRKGPDKIRDVGGIYDGIIEQEVNPYIIDEILP